MFRHDYKIKHDYVYPSIGRVTKQKVMKLGKNEENKKRSYYEEKKSVENRVNCWQR
jgi:hypothetical protein